MKWMEVQGWKDRDSPLQSAVWAARSRWESWKGLRLQGRRVPFVWCQRVGHMALWSNPLFSRKCSNILSYTESSESSVSDPHHVDADPDPVCNFDANQDPACNFDADRDSASNFDADPDRDPTFHSDADPDPKNPSFQIKAYQVQPWKSAQIVSQSIHFGLSSVNWCGSGYGSRLSLWCWSGSGSYHSI